MSINCPFCNLKLNLLKSFNYYSYVCVECELYPFKKYKVYYDLNMKIVDYSIAVHIYNKIYLLTISHENNQTIIEELDVSHYYNEFADDFSEYYFPKSVISIDSIMNIDDHSIIESSQDIVRRLLNLTIFI